MEVKISQWGNSTALRLPVHILEETEIKVGSTVEVAATKDGGLTIKPVKEKMTLAKLIKETPKDVALLRADHWDEMPPAGKET